MKRIHCVICICIFFTLTLVSCDNTNKENDITTINQEATETSSRDNKDLIVEKTNEELLSRIENLEKEISYLKEALQGENHIMNNQGAIINALDDSNGDNILVGIEREDGYLNAVHVKVPSEEYLSYDFYLLTGFENDGIPILNCLIKPAIEISDNPEKIDIDLKKFTLYKLMMSNLKYDETSIALIIIIDSNGKEYSQFIPSDRSMGDI